MKITNHQCRPGSRLLAVVSAIVAIVSIAYIPNIARAGSGSDPHVKAQSLVIPTTAAGTQDNISWQIIDARYIAVSTDYNTTTEAVPAMGLIALSTTVSSFTTSLANASPPNIGNCLSAFGDLMANTGGSIHSPPAVLIAAFNTGGSIESPPRVALAA